MVCFCNLLSFFMCAGPTTGKRSKNRGISPENSADIPAEDGIVFVGKIERKPGSSQGTARLSASDFEVEYRYDDSERGDGETIAKSNLMRSRRRLNNRKDGSTIEMSDNGETFARRISKGQNNVAEESEINVYSPRKMRGKEINTQWTDLENENEEQERKVISVDLSFHSNEAESPPPSSAARRVSIQPSQRGENVTMSYKPRDRNITSNPVREDSQPHARRSFSKPSLHRRRFSKNTDNHKRTQNKESKIEKSNFEFPSKDEMEDLETTTARKFYEMPNSKPKNVCFDFPGVDLTFLDVKRAIEAIIPDAFEANKVVSVQFENVNVKLGTRSRQNRWHIELADFVTRNKLIKSGLTIKQYRKPNIEVIESSSNKDRSCEQALQRTSVAAGKMENLTIQVKLYDMVMMEEYKLFLRRNAAEEKLQTAILMCAGRGHTLLSTML